MRKLNSGLFGRLEDPYSGMWWCFWINKKNKTREGIVELIIQNERKDVKPKAKEYYRKSYSRRNSYSGKRLYCKKKRRGR